MRIQPDIHRAEPWTDPLQIAEFGEAPAYRMPLVVAVNDTPALLCSLLVVEPRSPLALGSGIVSAIGVNPSRPDVHVHLQLVGAHRGWAHVDSRRRK